MHTFCKNEILKRNDPVWDRIVILKTVIVLMSSKCYCQLSTSLSNPYIWNQIFRHTYEIGKVIPVAKTEPDDD